MGAFFIHEDEGGIERPVPQDHCLTSLNKPRDAFSYPTLTLVMDSYTPNSRTNSLTASLGPLVNMFCKYFLMLII